MNRLCLALVWIALLAPGAALADGPAPEAPRVVKPVSYALIVGSNAGGAGQQPLRYAETDAQRVAEVLTTLGGYDAEHVTRLLQPTSAELFSTLAQLETTLAAHAQAGEATRFFFYYSGHARSDALNVGDERVALTELRERILGLPATLSVVVLDACQSGSFARTKGVGQAADFSFNSVGELSRQGVAVMASSTAKELSQESDELQSSHFTHHLLVALRGGGDVNGDGAVTLSEAYEYAYGRTLSSTSTTRVGEQHVTLETELTGHGDVALTRPVDASAHVVVPKSLVGRVLIQHLPSFAVAAELDKVAGNTVSLAFPPGRYAATVRMSDHALRCPLVLTDGIRSPLELDGCKRIELQSDVAKGGSSDLGGAGTTRAGSAPVGPDQRREGWFVELSAGSTRYARDDDYEQRLDAFGYQRGGDAYVGTIDLELALGRRLLPNFAVGVGYFDLDALSYESTTDSERTFELDAAGAWAFAQGDLFLGERRFLNVFLRGGVGYAFADSVFAARPVLPQSSQGEISESSRLMDVEDSYGGALLGAALGVQVNLATVFGLQLQGRYTYAPIVDNELGDTHDVGGLSVMFGLRFRTWEAP
jgi:uncharacterized caspase-like protein